ncbi:MAG: HD domain-containing phosphohydrolase [Sulfurimonas sp.]
MHQKQNILIIDDDTTNLHVLSAILKSDYKLHLEKDGTNAIESAKALQPDLILLDIEMSEKNGFEIAETINVKMQLDIPIIFVSASKTAESVQKAVELGAYDYITKPFAPNIVHKKVKNTLQKTLYLQLKRIYQNGVKLMESFFAEGPSAISKESIVQWAQELVSSFENYQVSIGKLVSFFEEDYTEASHNVNVSLLSVVLGRQLRMQHPQLLSLAVAAVLHDIGKFSIPKEIRNKPSRLDLQEEGLMQLHPIKSVELAKELGVKNTEILQAIKSHHEKLDGTGYPNYLIGIQIPLYAQILCVCDIFDALTTERTFRKKYSSFEALMMMKKEMSTQINERLVNALIPLLH